MNSFNQFTKIDELPGFIIVLGAHGQVGKALIELLGNKAIALSRNEIDLDQPEILREKLDQASQAKPIIALINAAAYTQVDLAEKEKEKAFRINAESPGILADWCKSKKIPLIHYSTDYVFNGEGNKPWTEEDPVSPQNSYGISKLEGEKRIQSSGCDFLIFRTSWVFDSTGKNFVNTMLRLGKERETLKVVSDQKGAPTYAPHLAIASLKALVKAQEMIQNQGNPFPSGVYHLCNLGETSWFEFAQTIFNMTRAKGVELKITNLQPISSAEYPTPAKRPLNSRLNTSKAKNILSIELPEWIEGLKDCLSAY